jgi:FMN phosphatase YigB (HAD superfamily)
MIDFSSITTLLFDIDNTLLTLDENEFLQVYSNLLHGFFQVEIPDIQKFIGILLSSTAKMYEKEPKERTTLSKFAYHFSSQSGLPQEEIIRRFLSFYSTDFQKVSSISTKVPIAKNLLILASNHFSIVAATTPLFPAIANEKRLGWADLNTLPWIEITSAEDYHFSKPHIEYYYELLNKISKKASECLMIGNDPINDMVAGKIGIKTFLVIDDRNNEKEKTKIITTSLDDEKRSFPVDYSGTLLDFYNSLKEYIKKQ